MLSPLITIRSNVVHTPTCHFVVGKEARWAVTELRSKEIHASRYRFCQHCSPVAMKYRAERKELVSHAAQSGMTLRQEQGLLYITSKHDQWIVAPSASMQAIVVYHKNQWNKPGPKPDIPGYHYQDFRCQTLLQVLKCIDAHDEYKKQVIKESKERKEREKKEAERAKQLAYETSVDYYKKKGKSTHTKKSGPKTHASHAKDHVIKADPCDWESFRALFRPNAAE